MATSTLRAGRFLTALAVPSLLLWGCNSPGPESSSDAPGGSTGEWAPADQSAGDEPAAPPGLLQAHASRGTIPVGLPATVHVLAWIGPEEGSETAREPAPRLPAPPGTRVSLVVDDSESMARHLRGEFARRAIERVIDTLPDGVVLSIVFFWDRARLALQPTRLGRDREAVKAVLSGLERRGMTNYSAALDQALLLLREARGAAYLFFLTDGLPTAGETDRMRLVERMTALRQAGIHPVFVGVGEAVEGDLLSRLAREGGGLFVPVDRLATLPAALQAISVGAVRSLARDGILRFEPASGVEIVGFDSSFERAGNELVAPVPLVIPGHPVVAAVRLRASARAEGVRRAGRFVYEYTDAAGVRRQEVRSVPLAASADVLAAELDRNTVVFEATLRRLYRSILTELSARLDEGNNRAARRVLEAATAPEGIFRLEARADDTDPAAPGLERLVLRLDRLREAARGLGPSDPLPENLAAMVSHDLRCRDEVDCSCFGGEVRCGHEGSIAGEN